MRLTREGEYGVRSMLYLCKVGPNRTVSRKEVAAEMEIPEQFLAKVVKRLATKGFLEILQGSRGGYRLLVRPEDVTLLDVVEAMEGEIFLNDCLMQPGTCFREQECAINRTWKRARESMRGTLRQSDFATLIREESCLLGSGHEESNE